MADGERGSVYFVKMDTETNGRHRMVRSIYPTGLRPGDHVEVREIGDNADWLRCIVLPGATGADATVHVRLASG